MCWISKNKMIIIIALGFFSFGFLFGVLFPKSEMSKHYGEVVCFVNGKSSLSVETPNAFYYYSAEGYDTYRGHMTALAEDIFYFQDGPLSDSVMILNPKEETAQLIGIKDKKRYAQTWDYSTDSVVIINTLFDENGALIDEQ